MKKNLIIAVVLYSGALVGMGSPRDSLCAADAHYVPTVHYRERKRIEMSLSLDNNVYEAFFSANPQEVRDVCTTNVLSVKNPFSFDLLVFYKQRGRELQLVRVTPGDTRMILFDAQSEYNVEILSTKEVRICGVPFSSEE